MGNGKKVWFFLSLHHSPLSLSALLSFDSGPFFMATPLSSGADATVEWEYSRRSQRFGEWTGMGVEMWKREGEEQKTRGERWSENREKEEERGKKEGEGKGGKGGEGEKGKGKVEGGKGGKVRCEYRFLNPKTLSKFWCFSQHASNP